MKKKIIYMALLILSWTVGIQAQTDGAIKVRLFTNTGVEIKSPRITEINEDGIHYFSELNKGTLPYTDINTVEVINTKSRAMMSGMMGGSGVFFGFIIGFRAAPEPENLVDVFVSPATKMTSGMIGAIIGGTAGYFLGRRLGTNKSKIDFNGKSTQEQILKLKKQTNLLK